MSLESLLAEDTCTLQRQKVVADSSGGPTRPTWTTVAESVPCKVEEASSAQRLQWAAMQIPVSHVVYTQRTDIQNGDRLLTSDGEYIRVNGVRRQRAMGGIAEYWIIAGYELDKPV